MVTAEQLIDALVCGCNDAVNDLVGGHYIAWCKRMCEMVQTLGQLKSVIVMERNEMERLKKILQDNGIDFADSEKSN